MKKHTLQENYERLFGPIKENWWDNLSDKSKQSYIKKHGSAPNVAKDGKGSEPEDKPVGGDTGKDADFGANIEDHEFEELHSPLEVEDFIEKYDDKLSDEQKDEINDLAYDLEDAEDEMAQGIIDDDEYEELKSDIQGKIANVARGN